MKTRVFLLMGFLALWSEMTNAFHHEKKDPSGQEIREKPGSCPAFQAQCDMINPPDKCDHDFQCDELKKCCTGFCGKDCYFPELEKPGSCPVFEAQCYMLNPPDKCDHDFQCQGQEKCCKGICGKDCYFPKFDK